MNGKHVLQQSNLNVTQLLPSTKRERTLAYQFLLRILYSAAFLSSLVNALFKPQGIYRAFTKECFHSRGQLVCKFTQWLGVMRCGWIRRTVVSKNMAISLRERSWKLRNWIGLHIWWTVQIHIHFITIILVNEIILSKAEKRLLPLTKSFRKIRFECSKRKIRAPFLQIHIW